jgi:integrase
MRSVPPCPEQVRSVLAVTSGDRLHPLVAVAAMTGLRRGEPKTARGRRVVPLPSVALAEMKTWKATWAADRLRERSGRQATGYVFTNEVGAPLDPSNVSAWYAWCAERVRVSNHGMHALRHSAATLILMGGLPVRVVAGALGHADVTVTLNTHAHRLDGELQAAVHAVADALAVTRDG